MASVSIILKFYLSLYRLFQSFSIKNFLLSLVLQENITLYIGVVHNIAQSEHCNNELREMGFVDVLLTYLETESVTPFLLTLSTLAELVDDSEARLLETDAHFFELLLKYLKNAIDNRRRRFSGWSARELARSNHNLIFYFLSVCL